MSDWFSGLSDFANNAISFADNLADNLVAQATEAEDQLRAEQTRAQREQQERDRQNDQSTYLPWETTDETLTILSQDLMEQVLAVSLHENNFTTEACNAKAIEFSFKTYIPVIMKLLQLDANLARMHSKLSPKMDEEVFWFNYYCRIVYLRAIVGMDGEAAKAKALIWNRDEMLFSNEKVDIKASYSSSTSAHPHSTRTDGVTDGISAGQENNVKIKKRGLQNAESLDKEKLDASTLLEQEVEAALGQYFDADDDKNGDGSGRGGDDVDDDDLDNLDFLDDLDLNDLDGGDDDDLDEAALDAELYADLNDEDCPGEASPPGSGESGGNNTTSGSSYVNLDSNFSHDNASDP